MKRILLSAAAALALAGCSAPSSEDSSSLSETDSASVSEVSSGKVEFDGTNYQETPEGELVLTTNGGTTENGNIPVIAADPNSLLQIGINTSGFNGEVITVYVDGIENTKLNAGTYLNQSTINLTGDALSPGEHTVEIVSQTEGSDPTIYKKALYKVEGQ